MPGIRLDDPALVNAHVGLRIKRRRHQMDMPQEELATAVGVTHAMIYKYERGVSTVSLPTLLLVAQALQTTPAYFYEELTTPAKPNNRDDVYQAFAATQGSRDLAESFLSMSIANRVSLRDVAKRYARG